MTRHSAFERRGELMVLTEAARLITSVVASAAAEFDEQRGWTWTKTERGNVSGPKS